METEKRNSRWDFQPSAKQIMIGDVVCLFEGASQPTIMRFCGDLCAIIVIAATSPQMMRGKSEDIRWSTYLQKVNQLRIRKIRKIRCTWNWDKSPGKVPGQDQEEYNTAWSFSDQSKEVWKYALALGDAEEDEKAAGKFQEAMNCYEIACQEGCAVELSADLLSFTSSVDLELMNKRYSQQPLSWAAERSYEAVMGLLIESLNANVDSKDKIGRTAVLFAAAKGQLAAIERLLREKADVNAAAAIGRGRTALQAAAGGGHIAVVEWLLQEKANVNAAAAPAPAIGGGGTALHAAEEGDHPAVIGRLQSFQEQQSSVEHEPKDNWCGKCSHMWKSLSWPHLQTHSRAPVQTGSWWYCVTWS
jgi:hypothetical protein